MKMGAPKTAAKPPSAPLPQFLAGGGRSRGGGKKDNSAEDARRKQIGALGDANRFDQDIRRAQMDVLSATRDLSTDYIERATLSAEILDLERQAHDSQLKYETELFKLSKGEQGLSELQAAQLKAEFDKKNALEAQKIIQEERAQRVEDVNRLEQLDFELERDRLESTEQLARTASEQRDIQLRLLDLSYRQEKARLDAVIADEQSSEAAKEEARRRLANLKTTYSNDRATVMDRTQGPMEQFFSDVPRNAAETAEAMERLKVQGIDGAINSIIALQDGFESFRQTALSAVKQVIAELIRMQLMKTAMSIFGAATGSPVTSTASLASMGNAGSIGSLPVFATGGFVSGPGGPTADKVPAMLSNGEFVMNSKAVRSFGLPFLSGLNNGSIRPEMLFGAAGMAAGGGGGMLKGAAGMGLFGAAGLLATGKKLPIFGVLGKVLGFSKGGPVGLPIPRAPRFGAMPALAGGMGGGGNHFSVTVNGAMSDAQARRTGMQIALAANHEMSRARTKGLG